VIPTPRDAEVLELTLGGKSPGEIADELGLSKHTVYHSQGRLRRRWLARDTPELIRLELRQRLMLAEAARDDARQERDQCRRDLAVLDRRGRTGG
jgi:DNA-binding CsgD family transcriptional regulator